MQEFISSRRAVLKYGLGVAAALPLLGAARTAFAQNTTLRIALSGPPTSLDPHLYNAIPNNALARHIFDPLVLTDEKVKSIPGLASSWREVDATHWEFDLRQDAKFSDGSPLTGEDIVASIERASSISSPGNFQIYTRSIKSITPDGNKLLIETTRRDPLLPNSFSRIGIIKAQFRNATTADFNNRSAAIGTGPFIIADYVPGDRINLVRNDSYWGPKPAFERVEMKIVSDDAARIAALLSGDYDLVEDLPHTGIERVEASPDLQVIRGMSGRLIYLAMDQHSEISPFVKDKAGQPLKSNPFKDLRVRKALSLAINREAIVKQVMAGEAEVASQFLPVGQPGTSPDIESDRYDTKAAQALLAEAGYPDGFRLTLHGPNDRYINDAKIVQAVAQMFSRIGIATAVEVMPWSVYSKRNNSAEFSVSLSSWGTNTGETSNPLSATIATTNAEKGFGGSNPGRYSNPGVDENLEKAAAAKNDTERYAILAETSKIAFEDKAILPLHREGIVVGARKTIQYTPRSDQFISVAGAKPI
ncbi:MULTISPECIES: ABC transporter substrate-binding protein [Agrobacterium]|uniref:ABC transporter, substrate-binding protein, family 5 n=1 Tax=Agrobacterium deltaense NCPPB 1641 TaxID=1183425 RepID=A0A1S7TID7_9HYPH|nr:MULTISPECIES: ABC transporter substrate-binding protein [Agrobacterium]QNP82373.1 ABC transporter substrate-binding protein [Agrobacterium tumefaciens]WFS65140.1 ABC transporter substrate-binding protein [Agrobacterium leguminum]CVI54301.1 ABC transporter, substrate-binding protein, family 5 [Agrobacterium deltaense NCPPB 1641]